MRANYFFVLQNFDQTCLGFGGVMALPAVAICLSGEFFEARMSRTNTLYQNLAKNDVEEEDKENEKDATFMMVNVVLQQKLKKDFE